MHSKSTKRLFLFIMIYLPFQYLLVGVIGYYDSEPWPAFVLPGFKSVYANQEKVEIDEVNIYAMPDEESGKRIEVAPTSLFEGLPRSQLQGFFRSNFSENKEWSSEGKRWFRQQLENLYPGQTFNSIQVEWIEVRYEHSGDTMTRTGREISRVITISLGTM